MKAIELPIGRRLPPAAWLAFSALLACGAWLAVPRLPAPAEAPRSPARRLSGSGHFDGKVNYDLLAKLLADDRRDSAGDWLMKLAIPAATFPVPTQEHPLLDRPAVDFTLRNHRGEPWNLHERLARGPIVLVFYLGYGCTACVHDLFVLDADLARFHELGAEVVAVSGDNAALTQSRFEEFGAFGFSVLSDPGHAVANHYGALRMAAEAWADEPLHATFVIARDRRVRWVYRAESPLANNQALLYEVARIENRLPRRRDRDEATGRHEEKEATP